MVLSVFYDNNGKINRVIRGTGNRSLAKDAPGHKGIVRECPTELFNMPTNRIREEYRVADEINGFVRLERGKKA